MTETVERELSEATEEMERRAAEWLDMKAAGLVSLAKERELTEAEQRVRRLGGRLERAAA